MIYYLHQYNNHAYLWSTENGYDFFVEQKIGINRRNINNIAKLLRIYGTDSLSENISDALQGFKYGGRRASDLVRALKREGAASTNTVGDRRGVPTDRIVSEQEIMHKVSDILKLRQS